MPLFVSSRSMPDICYMRTASVSEIKQELKALPPAALLEMCLRLTRAKKENKELLTYLLFEAHDPASYIMQLKELIDEELAAADKHNLYILKKNLRKTLRLLNKHLRFPASKAAETEVLLYFCQQLHQHKIPYRKNNALANLYYGQIKKITTAIATLHEDLQHDFTRQLDELP